MLDFIDRSCFFQAGVFEQKALHESAVQSDVNVFIDRRRNQETAMLTIIRGQVCPSATERNAQWRTRDDHCFLAAAKRFRPSL